MIKYFRYLFVAVATFCAVGCIENDIPYPVIEMEIIDIDSLEVVDVDTGDSKSDSSLNEMKFD